MQALNFGLVLDRSVKLYEMADVHMLGVLPGSAFEADCGKHAARGNTMADYEVQKLAGLAIGGGSF